MLSDDDLAAVIADIEAEQEESKKAGPDGSTPMEI